MARAQVERQVTDHGHDDDDGDHCSSPMGSRAGVSRRAMMAATSSALMPWTWTCAAPAAGRFSIAPGWRGRPAGSIQRPAWEVLADAGVRSQRREGVEVAGVRQRARHERLGEPAGVAAAKLHPAAPLKITATAGISRYGAG
jgi:hypothetical protein